MGYNHRIIVEKASREQLIDNYGKAYEQIVDAIKDFPKEMWHHKPSEEKWSIHEILIHLADSEVNSYARCRMMLAEPGSQVIAYDQDAWTRQLNYHNQSTNDALELFKWLRKMNYDLIRSLPDDKWGSYVMHSEIGKFTLDKWLSIYEPHIPGHIEQMRKVFEDWKSKKQ